MVGRPSSQSTTRRWHRLLEHYTPDGALGRSLFAIASGSASGFFLLATLFSVAATNLLLFFLFPLWLGLSLGTAVLTVVTLWPVYLSLIGNVESAKAYPRASSPPSDGNDDADPIEVLKREYAAGNVPQTEFERRLDVLLHADGRSRNERTHHRRDVEDAARETDPN